MEPRNRIVEHIRALAGPGREDDAPDRDLVQSFLARHDQAAFSALVRRHGPMVLGVCRRVLRNDTDAEDAFQTTFLVLARRAGALRALDSVGSWLYGIAYRSALKARASLARRRARETAAPTRTPANPLAEMTVAEAQAAVDEELARLPDRFRAPLVLCGLEGLTRDEAAQQLGWSVGLVKSRLEQARELLRKRLGTRGLALPAGLLALGLATGTATAAVPVSLAGATAHAACQAALGVPLSTLVSSHVAALTEEWMRTFAITQLKIALSAALLCLTLGIGTTSVLLAMRADDRPVARVADKDRPAPAEPVSLKPESLQRWSGADVLLVGRLVSAQAGPVARSNPPIYTHRLQVRIDKVLRGGVKAGEQILAFHSIRQQNAPTFPVGKDCLVSLNKSRGQWTIKGIVENTSAELAQARLAAQVPIGWSSERGLLVSPWAKLGKTAWPEEARARGPLVCSVTGRPAQLVGDGVEFSVEPVPPKVKLKYGNPDGDGEYRIIVKNTTDKAVTIPALVSDGKNILWNESLVIVCQDKIYTIPSAMGVKTTPKAVTLKPGETISTVVNTFALKGPEWPRGGYRIEFQFGLGEKSVTHSFYYLSKHHDPIRERAQGGK